MQANQFAWSPFPLVPLLDDVIQGLHQLLEAPCSTESHFQPADRVQTHQFVTQMSADRLQPMLIAMSQAEVVVPAALAHDRERVDVQALDGREERDVVGDVAEESAWLVMEDPRRHKKNLMQRWKITGVRRRMALTVVL